MTILNPTIKICPECGEEKVLTRQNFAHLKGEPFKFRSICKRCIKKIQSKKRYISNAETYRKKRREYYAIKKQETKILEAKKFLESIGYKIEAPKT